VTLLAGAAAAVMALAIEIATSQRLQALGTMMRVAKVLPHPE
jgi:hypothetical protein